MQKKRLSSKSKISFLNDKNQYESVFRQYYKPLCRFAFTFLKDKDDAEEIVQNLFVYLWNNSQNIEINTSVEAYLYLCVKNRCFNQLKHIKIRENYKEHNYETLKNKHEHTSVRVETNDLEEHLTKAIEQMPEKRRQVFVLSRYEGLSYNEIAQKMDISVKTVENQMTSALKFLRQKLDKFLIFLIFLTFAIGELIFLIVIIKI